MSGTGPEGASSTSLSKSCTMIMDWGHIVGLDRDVWKPGDWVEHLKRFVAKGWKGLEDSQGLAL